MPATREHTHASLLGPSRRGRRVWHLCDRPCRLDVNSRLWQLPHRVQQTHRRPGGLALRTRKRLAGNDGRRSAGAHPHHETPHGPRMSPAGRRSERGCCDGCSPAAGAMGCEFRASGILAASGRQCCGTTCCAFVRPCTARTRSAGDGHRAWGRVLSHLAGSRAAGMLALEGCQIGRPHIAHRFSQTSRGSGSTASCPPPSPSCSTWPLGSAGNATRAQRGMHPRVLRKLRCQLFLHPPLAAGVLAERAYMSVVMHERSLPWASMVIRPTIV